MRFKIGVDLVGILHSPHLQKQSLVDALKLRHNGLLAWILGLCRSFQIGDVGLSLRLIGPDRSKRFEIVRQYRESLISTVAALCGNSCCCPEVLKLP